MLENGADGGLPSAQWGEIILETFSFVLSSLGKTDDFKCPVKVEPRPKDYLSHTSTSIPHFLTHTTSRGIVHTTNYTNWYKACVWSSPL